MDMMRAVRPSIAPAVLACVAIAFLPAAGASPARKTHETERQQVLGLHYGPLANLMAAYNRESNAQTTYLAFAKRADQEGFAGAAALFRAAARAEGIHARNHADVIKLERGTPRAEIKVPPTGDTLQNVKAALEGEAYERDTMYPTFISEAQGWGNTHAIRAFKMAASAEADHARLFAAAANEVTLRKAPKTFYVCPVCGKTVAVVDFDRCPVCSARKSRFAEVL